MREGRWSRDGRTYLSCGFGMPSPNCPCNGCRWEYGDPEMDMFKTLEEAMADRSEDDKPNPHIGSDLNEFLREEGIPCGHPVLNLASGGHYVFCPNCRGLWCSRPEGDGAMTAETYRAAMGMGETIAMGPRPANPSPPTQPPARQTDTERRHIEETYAEIRQLRRDLRDADEENSRLVALQADLRTELNVIEHGCQVNPVSSRVCRYGSRSCEREEHRGGE